MSSRRRADRCCCCACVNTNTTGILERFGRFIELLEPGCACFCCLTEEVYEVPNNVQQLENETQTKTMDDVNIGLVTAVQYKIDREDTQRAFYSLQDPKSQIESYIDNTIRSTVPTLTLQQLFESKDHLSVAVKSELTRVMSEYGYKIVNTLLTDIKLPAAVQTAMNAKNENVQYKLATVEKAEAQKIATVANAEAQRQATVADGQGKAEQQILLAKAQAEQNILLAKAQAEADRLRGQGQAQRQLESTRGLEEATKLLVESTKVSVAEASQLVMANSYLDTLKSIGANDKATILVPYTANVQDVLRNVFIQGQQANQ